EDGECIASAMQQALLHAAPNSVDAVFLHGPGTVLGDRAEKAAVLALFRDGLPNCYSTKWLFGHTLGASGVLSLLAALWQMQNGRGLEFPYAAEFENSVRPINTALINSAGFGGGACSV